MLENGELEEVFPTLTGDWLTDKKQFIAEQKSMEEMLQNRNIIFEDTDNEYYD